jgi:hypothetical protein
MTVWISQATEQENIKERDLLSPRDTYLLPSAMNIIDHLQKSFTCPHDF